MSQQQTDDLEEILLERLSDDLEENVDISEVVERLLQLQRRPLNLNTADQRDLADLIFLTPQQIESILHHRRHTGDFRSILELQGIRNIDFQTAQLLRLFVEVKSTTSLKDVRLQDVMHESDQLLFLRYSRTLQTQQGFRIDDPDRSRYLGDPNRYAVRYRLDYESKIKIALNMEKDAGEPFFAHKQGFDFYSGHIAFNHVNKYVKQIVLGDYALQFGQGLVLWNGLSFGKGAWIGGAARQGVGLRPYSSMNENRFNRGFATSLLFSKFEVTPFVSLNKLTGNIEEGDFGQLISSINYSGLHRTPTELANRRSIDQLNYGLNVSYQHDRLKVGMTYLRTSFSGIIQQGNSLYQQFDFEGRHVNQIGIFYNYTYRNAYIYGETAKSLVGGMATSNGLLVSLHPKISAIAHYRNYQRDYHQFYAQALGEGSRVVNERGVYSGIVYHPSRRVEWSNYLDVFSFPWLRYRVDAPSHGMDFLSQFTYTWYKLGAIKIRYRHRMNQENTLPEGGYENTLANVLRNQLRGEFQYKLNNIWTIRSRIEWSLYDKELEERSTGILTYQDVFWKSRRGKLQANIRLAYFDTEGYNARIYAYENDVLYASSFPMYYDKGVRTYLNLRWRLGRKIDVWGRYAMTKYSDKEYIGSGLDRIDGDRRSDIKLQCRWQW